MSTTETLLTAEQFAQLGDTGRPTELVRGRIVPMNPPGPRHGQICMTVAQLLREYVDQHALGHVLINDTGVITERDPDTVRGADVAFYSYHKVPRGPLPHDYLPVPPDLMVEILSPGDRQSQVLAKVAEYLNVGVTAVCVLDDRTKTVQIFFADQPVRTLAHDDQLTLADILHEFRVPVRRLFE